MLELNTIVLCGCTVQCGIRGGGEELLVLELFVLRVDVGVVVVGGGGSGKQTDSKSSFGEVRVGEVSDAGRNGGGSY